MRNCDAIFLYFMIFATITVFVTVFVFLLKHLKMDMKEKRCFRTQNTLIAETSFLIGCRWVMLYAILSPFSVFYINREQMQMHRCSFPVRSDVLFFWSWSYRKRRCSEIFHSTYLPSDFQQNWTSSCMYPDRNIWCRR